MALAVPEALMTRFRAVAMERLQRIDETWTALVRGETSTDNDAQLLRDVHSLKGDAKVVGLVEASLLCQRLEDLLAAARARGYRVHEDVDVVVTMTVQFIAMLVRKRSAGGGIDLKGFLKQVEEVMSEWLCRSSEAPDKRLSVGPHLRVKDRDRVTESSGMRLSTATTSVYLEQLRVPPGDTRARLRSTWSELLEGVLEAHRAPMSSIIHPQVKTAKEIAEGLGKRVTVFVSGDDIAVGPETAEALGVALLHGLRNAIDHGIETPINRQKAGKPQVGTIKIELTRDGDSVRLVVEDDGSGVDIERVRARAVERGLMSTEVAPHATPDRVIECLFASGFSTRDATSEISGRGIGLDAAAAAIRDLGGEITLDSSWGWGATLSAAVTDARGALQVLVFDAPYCSSSFAVPAAFGVRRSDGTSAIVLEDVLRLPRERAGEAIPVTVFGGGTSVTLATGSKPVARHALRKCPTASEELVEVVWIGEREVILIRPEALRERLASG